MLAAVGVGAHDDVWAASAAIGSPESEPVEPTADPAVRRVYERRYQVFKSLYPALREPFHNLREETRDRATDPCNGQDDMKASTAKTVTCGGFGKRA